MTIIIDSREPDRIKQLLSKRGVDIKGEFIEVADYLLSDGYAIERKDDDIITSIKSRRIFEQLNNLCNYDRPILALNVDNLWRLFYYANSNYIHKQWVGFINTVIIKYPKLKLMPYSGEQQFIDLLVSLENKIHDTGEKKSRPKPIMRKPRSLSDSQENILCAIKGISVPTSKKLLKHYGSVSKVINATQEQHLQIDKVGKALASRIYEVCNAEYKKNSKKK